MTGSGAVRFLSILHTLKSMQGSSSTPTSGSLSQLLSLPTVSSPAVLGVFALSTEGA
ncbi:hypothetical protein DPMN_034320 [Dreissena polymorpha]|uniref:Uncharacterized protein n=1 Tax=Dreissena polymorpha TaxID=45954 RepID=A0A9D4RJM9_DREPO|nr:hypothetical protein DPMN_034320 [Dreissena polymorpha]